MLSHFEIVHEIQSFIVNVDQFPRFRGNTNDVIRS